MRVGSIVYATDQGLGILAESFYSHGIVTHPLIIEHHHRTTNFSWYPPLTPHTTYARLATEGRRLIDSVDTLLFFETPFDWSLVSYARQRGKKVAIMPMHECMPREVLHHPDLWICPSALDKQSFPENSVQLTVPVCADQTCPCLHKVFPRLRHTANIFTHNAGHGGLRGRNGTAEFIQALISCKTPTTFRLLSQKSIDMDIFRQHFPEQKTIGGDIFIGGTDTGKSLTYVGGTIQHHVLYKDGDVFVFPEKFNGLSLPLQEAYASGMLVLATNRFPNNTWLPNEPLIPVSGYSRSRVGPAYRDFDEAIVNPADIASTIEAWSGKSISEYSSRGIAWGQINSWTNLKSVYMETLSSLYS